MDKRVIKFTIYGKPKSKDNFRQVNRYTGRPFFSSELKRYELEVQKQFMVANARQRQETHKSWQMFTGDVRLEMIFYYADRRCLDLQNSTKSICDALQGFLYKNDRQITELFLAKKYDKENPRVEITAREI